MFPGDIAHCSQCVVPIGLLVQEANAELLCSKKRAEKCDDGQKDWERDFRGLSDRDSS